MIGRIVSVKSTNRKAPSFNVGDELARAARLDPSIAVKARDLIVSACPDPDDILAMLGITEVAP